MIACSMQGVECGEKRRIALEKPRCLSDGLRGDCESVDVNSNFWRGASKLADVWLEVALSLQKTL